MVKLPNCNDSQTLQYGNWLIDQIHKLALPHQSSNFGIVTISVGVTSQIPTEQLTISDLIQCCDMALYDAKHQGRDRVCVYQGDPLETQP